MKYRLHLSCIFFIAALAGNSCKQTTDTTPMEVPLIVSAGGDIGKDIFFSDKTLRDRSYSTGIHSLNYDGTGLAFLFRAVNIYSAPRGNKVLFTRNVPFIATENPSTEFYLGDIAGKSAQRLFTVDGSATFAVLSPDAEKIVYAVASSSDFYVKVYDIKNNVTSGGFDYRYIHPPNTLSVFSDDSKKLLISLEGTDGVSNLYVTNTDRTDEQLVADDAASSFNNDVDYNVHLSDWSPDGKKICYFAHIPGSSHYNYYYELHIKDLATNVVEIVPMDSSYSTVVRYSADGKSIAFEKTSWTDPKRSGTVEIYDVASKQLRSFQIPYVHLIGRVHDLDWSSDGKSLLLVTAESDGGYDTFKTLMRLDISAGTVVKDYNIPNIQPTNLYRTRALGEH